MDWVSRDSSHALLPDTEGHLYFILHHNALNNGDDDDDDDVDNGIEQFSASGN
jgi:hypothetical protein